MTRLPTLLISALLLTPAVSTVYTGFNYGAFWGVESYVKKVADFLDSFSYAQNLSTGVPFNSARLFTCKTQGTVDEPTGAFDAAVDTKTNLLLGFWMTPQKRGDPLDDIIKNELSALEKGFQKHGQALADLVIGLSVGSEDIYRWEETDEKEVGVSVVEISASIQKVKEAVDSSTFAAYMKDKPIGHVDTSKYAVVDNADFFGMTAYPYWNKDPVAKGKESFLGSLKELKQRAGNTPIWIAEIGWPYEGAQQGKAVASAENLQQYWTEVGCSVMGMYTTFWFELIKDSEANQPDWGLLDPTTHKPRIELHCPGLAEPSASAAPASSSPGSPSTTPASQPNQTTVVTFPSPSKAPASSSQSNRPSVGIAVPSPPSTAITKSTIHVTTTILVTVQPSSAKASSYTAPRNSSIVPPKVTTTVGPTILPSNISWCVTVADIAWNGQYVPVAGNPAGPDGKCTPPPTYVGLPYGSNHPTRSPYSSSVPKSDTSSVSSPSNSKAAVSLVIPPLSPGSSVITLPNLTAADSSNTARPIVPSSLAASISASGPANKPLRSSQDSYSPAPPTELPASSKSTKPSGIALPSFKLVSNVPAAEYIGYSRKRRRLT